MDEHHTTGYVIYTKLVTSECYVPDTFGHLPNPSSIIMFLVSTGFALGRTEPHLQHYYLFFSVCT